MCTCIYLSRRVDFILARMLDFYVLSYLIYFRITIALLELYIPDLISWIPRKRARKLVLFLSLQVSMLNKVVRYYNLYRYSACELGIEFLVFTV